MKIAATTVGTQGPETPAQNQQRLEAAKHALIKAKAIEADVLVLPGGFFTSGDSQSREHIANSLISEAKRSDMAVVFGVDEIGPGSSQVGAKGKWRKQTTGWWPETPMYGYAWSPTEKATHCWRQRSTNRTDQWLVDDKRCKEVRLLMIGDEALGVLMCGEIFNERIRDALRKHEPRPKVVADLGHEGRWYRVHHGMEALAEGEQGIASMCSLHVQGQNAKKRYCTPSRGYMSTNVSDRIVYGPPRIEIKLWEF